MNREYKKIVSELEVYIDNEMNSTNDNHNESVRMYAKGYKKALKNIKDWIKENESEVMI